MLRLVLIAVVLVLVQSFPEQGRWQFDLTKDSMIFNVSKSLYKNSTIKVHFTCKGKASVKLQVKSVLRWSPCVTDYIGEDENEVEDWAELNGNHMEVKEKDFICTNVPTDVADGALLVHNDSIYLLMVEVTSDDQTVSNSTKFHIDVDVQMIGPHGYLSAIDWPLLPFYSTMCVIYSLYSLIWLILCFCYWRDMLRVQLWIGAVIFLGLLEQSFFTGEYEAINKTGNSVQGAVITAELVSCLKRSLARMLVIIVSLGFGIIKPTLGPTLHRITALGFLYFVLSSAEAIVRVIRHKTDSSTEIMVTIICLALIDSIICWWVFISIVQTIRTLLLRKNLVKLALYRHFRNTLIFGVVASVIYAVWSMQAHKMSECLEDWKELWVDDAFWHWSFSLLLLVIMILWRPSANNQRYSYSPLYDIDDFSEDVDQGAHEALGDIKKIRNLKGNSNGSYREKETVLDEDLKWVDENIPTSALDISLPGLLDADDDVVKRHKEEISKMQ